jgi:hypothetical protein
VDALQKDWKRQSESRYRLGWNRGIEDHPFSLCNTIQNIKVRLQTHIPFFVNFVAAAVKAKKNNFSTSKDSEI